MAADSLDESQLTELLLQFDRLRAAYEDLRIEIEKELVTSIAALPLRIHSCKGRVKARDSYRDKVIRKRYPNPISDMHDIVGVRVVCLFLDDVEQVDQVVRTIFDVIKYEDKTKSSAPDRFGYRSVHYDCRLPASHSGPHYDHIKNIVFEVQVRTILQDAWAVVEHYLGYKGLNSIPNDSQADFGALVGLFHLADKTFQQIRDSSRSQDMAAKSSLITDTSLHHGGRNSPETTRTIDRSTLKALLRSLYPSRAESTDSEYSELVEEFARSSLTEIGKLRDLLERGEKIATDRLDARLSNAKEGAVRKAQDEIALWANLPDVRFARLCVGYSYPAFRLNRLKRGKT